MSGLYVPSIITGDPGVVINGAIDPHAAPFYAKGGAVGHPQDGTVTGGTVLTSASYSFGAANVGMVVFINGSERSIIGHDGAGGATLSSSVSNGSSLRWFCGFDDTAAIDAALQAARTWQGINVGTGTVSESSLAGPFPLGGVVRLRPTGYLVRNTQASYDGGKKSAIRVPRGCSLVGWGVNATSIYCGLGTIGDVLANENPGSSGWDHFMQIGGFGIYCGGSEQPSGFGYGCKFYWAFNNYRKVDVWNRVFAITVFDAKSTAFYYNGRGECIYTDLNAIWPGQYGHYADGTMDSRFIFCNSSGAQRTGWRINRSAAIQLISCKSFYSGAGGGTSETESANFALTADQFRNGQVQLDGCESQECRGSGFVIETGYNHLRNCLSSDPSRSASALGGGTRPSVRAAYRLRDVNGSNQIALCNTFSDCVATPSVSAFNGAPDLGTHTLYADANCKLNRGDIWGTPIESPYTSGGYEDATCAWNGRTYNGSNGTAGAAKGGTGTTNGNNLNLRVDGIACT